MTKITISHEFKPHEWQRQAYERIRNAQRIVMVVSRQMGKTQMLIDMLTHFVFTYNKFRHPRILVAGKTSESVFNTFFTRMHNNLKHLPTEVYSKRGTKDNTVLATIARPWFKDIASVTFCGIGNVSALRGGTFDLVLLDEYSLFPKDAWPAVIEPATKVRKAKAIFSGTPDGMGENPLWLMLKRARGQEKKGNKKYYACYLDVYQAGVWSDKEIAETKDEYYDTGNEHLWAQEYLVRFDALPSDEAPFNRKVANMAEQGHVMNEVEKSVLDRGTLHASVDVGAKGNMAVWFWTPDRKTGAPRVLGYDDQYDGVKNLVDRIVQEHLAEWQHCRVVFPNDIGQPDLTDGGTRLARIQEYVFERGYEKRITLDVLPKVKQKLSLWHQGLMGWRTLLWDTTDPGVVKGLSLLAGVRFKRRTDTGMVDFGNVVLNGNQHAGDAYLYMIADQVENKASIASGDALLFGSMYNSRLTTDYRNSMGPSYVERPQKKAANGRSVDDLILPKHYK